MNDVVIYTKTGCPYCLRAKQLLSSKGADFDEINIGDQPEKRAEMLSKSNGRNTVPQIFIGSTHVGGSDDLAALDDAGKLDALLKN